MKADIWKPKDEPPWEVRFKRNEQGWWSSVKLTFRVLFYAPSSLWWMVREALIGMIAGAFFLALNLIAWLCILTAQVAAGLCGFISEPKKKETADAG